MYPAMDPAMYRDVDDRFKQFMACGHGIMATQGNSRPMMWTELYSPARRPMTWDEIYSSGGGVAALLKKPVSREPAMKEMEGKGHTKDENEALLLLCSISKWDLLQNRCKCDARRDCFEPGALV